MLRVVHADKELWDSVSFIAPGLGETAVHLESEAERIALIFDFINEPDQPRKLDIRADGALTLKIGCVNFDDALPVTVNELMEIGSFLGRKLFLVFSVHKIGSAELRQVNVSIYLGELIHGQT